MNLQSIWDELTSRYTKDRVLIGKLWAELEKSYGGKKRFYHNLTHIRYMVSKAMLYRSAISDIDVLLFSIFYHDIVYDATRQDNEQKSAELAIARLTTLSVPPEKIAECHKQIMATKHHAESGEPDVNFVLDLDLAILGDTPDLYDEYCKNIRREYAIYPDLLYRTGRKKVLKHFLTMERIFKTDEFFARYEQPARVNMQRELETL